MSPVGWRRRRPRGRCHGNRVTPPPMTARPSPSTMPSSPGNPSLASAFFLSKCPGEREFCLTVIWEHVTSHMSQAIPMGTHRQAPKCWNQDHLPLALLKLAARLGPMHFIWASVSSFARANAASWFPGWAGEPHGACVVSYYECEFYCLSVEKPHSSHQTAGVIVLVSPSAVSALGTAHLFVGQAGPSMSCPFTF
jgi:hypothetical protein